MPQIVKKIIIYTDHGSLGYERRVYEYKSERFYQYSLGLEASFLPENGDLIRNEWRFIDMPLFNINNFTKICEKSDFYTIVNVILAENEYFEHIVTKPNNVPIDVYITSNNSLVYEFYLLTGSSNFVLKALKNNDGGKRYNKIKLNRANLSVRESIIDDAIKETALLKITQNKEDTKDITMEDLLSLGNKSLKGFLKRFYKLGDVWFIDFGATFGMFDNSIGIQYLHYIISHPGKNISLAELFCAINGGNQKELQAIFDISSKTEEDDFDKIRGTISTYEKNLKEINKKLKNSDNINKNKVKEYKQDKLYIEKEIKKLKTIMHYGPKTGSIEQERIRVSISKSISNAYKTLEKQELHNAVKYFKKQIEVLKGYTYTPEDNDNPWILSP